MKQRNLKKTFSPLIKLEFDNLLVGGCSFTYNNSEKHIVTWPYYLRDLCNFNSVIDCSLPGAGNYHISQSVMWSIECNNFDPDKTLVIVMWSGFQRDDCIIDSGMLNDYPFVFNYTKNTVSAITGGIGGNGNTKINFLNNLEQFKTTESRSIENFLYINSLNNFLQNKNFNFLFLNYLDYTLPNRSNEKNILNSLPKQIQNRYKQIMDTNVENIYKFCLKNNLLTDDDFHPSPDGHLEWTKMHLVPYLAAKYLKN